jgi:hypothetical protein
VVDVVHAPSAAELTGAYLEHAFAAARWQVDGLTDDEYFWEPRPDCWSVRCDAAGRWALDGDWPFQAPPHVTTVAWRLVHLAGWTEVYENWTFDDGTASFDAIDVPGTAAGAVEYLACRQEAFGRAFGRLADPDLATTRHTHWGDELPVGVLVWQIAVEHLHHGAEIGVLRDLRRGHGRTDAWPEPTDGRTGSPWA